MKTIKVKAKDLHTGDQIIIHDEEYLRVGMVRIKHTWLHSHKIISVAWIDYDIDKKLHKDTATIDDDVVLWEKIKT